MHLALLRLYSTDLMLLDSSAKFSAMIAVMRICVNLGKLLTRAVVEGRVHRYP
jgi:hypothetical protein